MGIDVIGQSPVLVSSSFEKKEIDNLKVECTSEVSDSDQSGENNHPRQKSRLGKILRLIEGESEQKRQNKKYSNPFVAYEKVGRLTNRKGTGEAIDIKV